MMDSTSNCSSRWGDRKKMELWYIISSDLFLSCLYSNGGISMGKKIPLVSLFCGAGGMDMGFENRVGAGGEHGVF